MPSSDKVFASSVEKAAKRELPNKGANIVNMSQGTSALPKDKGPPTADPGKAVVTKRQHSDTPSSPGYHNVYVRRKVESEHNKVNSSQELKSNGRDKTKEQETQQDVQHEAQQDVQHEAHQEVQHEAQKDVQHEAQKDVHEVQQGVQPEAQKDAQEEVQQDVQHEAHQDVQHDEVNKPQVASPVAKSVEPASSITSGKSNAETQQDVQHDKVNKPHMTSPVAKSVEPASSITSGKPDAATQQDVQLDEVNKPQVASPVAKSVEPATSITSGKPDAETVPKKTEAPVSSATGTQDDVEQSSIQYWSERFNRLQTYLENCDRSTQEGYLRKLRSLSAAGRSMHAIELEKRAIHLLVEEGKELQRMKALNVLGKVSPNASSKQTPLQRQFQK
ncbi:hypothetical protein EJB05_53853, partial [Eragrostis curvula]